MCGIADTYMFNSVSMAKYIVARANQEHIGINMTKLQKLLYIAYGASLTILNKRLVDEHPQAWPYGPVFPTTRNKLKGMEFSAITMDDAAIAEIKETQEVQQLITFVFEGFGRWYAHDLSTWSHQTGSPWDKTVHSDNFKWGRQISDDDIKDYFDRIIVRKENQQ